MLDKLNFFSSVVFCSDFKSSWHETKRESKTHRQYNPNEKDKTLSLGNLY